MSPDPFKKISIRVDISIEGQSGTPDVSVQTQQRPVLSRIDVITFPAANADWPVVVGSGINTISASGQYTLNPIRAVYAIAYPQPNSNFPPLPDPGAISFPANVDGTWSNNAIPGAGCDNLKHSTPNSTLVVWYDIGTGSSPITIGQIDTVNFHGTNPNCPSPLMPHHHRGARQGPAVLVATFTGSLSSLKSMKLEWNGVSWVADAKQGGGLVLSFTGNDPHYQLSAAGPGSAFVIAAPKTTCTPFSWSSKGLAYGSMAGEFTVTVTE